MPSLGTGANGFPPAAAAKAMLEATLEFDRRNPGGSLQAISFVIFQQQDLRVFIDEAQAICHAKGVGGDSPSRRRMSPTAGEHGYHDYDDDDDGGYGNPVHAGRSSAGQARRGGGRTGGGGTWAGGGSTTADNGSPGSVIVPGSNVQLDIQTGDISAATSDAIVTTAAKSLKMNETVMSRALLSACGGAVQNECNRLRSKSYREGDAFTTGAGNLSNCQKIIHAICPKCDSNGKRNLEKLVTNCLEEAKFHNLTSIAVPALGAGGLGYSPTLCAQATLSAVEKFASDPGSVTNISIVLFKPEHVDPFQRELKQQFPTASGSAQRAGSSSVPPRSTGRWSDEPPQRVPRPMPMPQTKRGIGTLSLSSMDSESRPHSLTLVGLSAKEVDAAKRKMIEFVKDNHSVVKVNDPSLHKLSAEDSRSIDVLQDEMGVVIRQCGTGLEVEGEKTKALEVNLRIVQIISQAAQAAMREQDASRLANQIQWCREVDGRPKIYGAMENADIENAYNGGQSTIQIQRRGRCFIVDFRRMVEYPDGSTWRSTDAVEVTRRDIMAEAKENAAAAAKAAHESDAKAAAFAKAAQDSDAKAVAAARTAQDLKAKADAAAKQAQDSDAKVAAAVKSVQDFKAKADAATKQAQDSDQKAAAATRSAQDFKAKADAATRQAQSSDAKAAAALKAAQASDAAAKTAAAQRDAAKKAGEVYGHLGMNYEV